MGEGGTSETARLSLLSHRTAQFGHMKSFVSCQCLLELGKRSSAANHPRSPQSPTSVSGNLPRQAMAGDSVGLMGLNTIVQAFESFPSTTKSGIFSVCIPSLGVLQSLLLGIRSLHHSPLVRSPSGKGNAYLRISIYGLGKTHTIHRDRVN